MLAGDDGLYTRMSRRAVGRVDQRLGIKETEIGHGRRDS